EPAVHESVRSFKDLTRLAKQLSAHPYHPAEPAPAELSQLSYDQYIKIRFRDEQGIWKEDESPFWLQSYHQGFVQRDRVELFVLDRSKSSVQQIPFSIDDFEFGDLELKHEEAGHAGLKILGRFPGRSDAGEILSFLGASYFRACHADGVYGASARGLAIDIAMNKDEEFPRFRAFWIEKPTKHQQELKVLGLLDSPSVAGAYAFRIVPLANKTIVDVKCELHFRRQPGKLAFAPLTSMWMWGDGLSPPKLDARPSVHDSDGLLIQQNDHWRWRPLARQSYPSVSSIPVQNLRGFGLIQRDREAKSFRDSNALYHKRPSLWVTPKNGPSEDSLHSNNQWQDGRIELLELPGAHEGIDSIGAYFVPNKMPEAGESRALQYTIEFFAGDPSAHEELAKLVDLRVQHRADSIELELDFETPSDPEQLSELQIRSSAVRGTITAQRLSPVESGVRLSATITPHEEAPVELDFRLEDNGKAITETVAYLLPHREPEFVYPAVYTRQEESP
ncbi:MAG: glucan biosynthesis protein, partial [Planctomycetota bacterium]